MTSFKETFKLAEQHIRPMLEEYGFKLDHVVITDDNGSIWVHGGARYIENTSLWYPFRKKRFVRISTTPLRLELDLDIGIGDNFFTIYELHELEGNQAFPKRTHDLYKAMYDENQLKTEFERLIQVLKDCGKRFFSNDTSLWSDLESQRNKHSIEKVNNQIFKEAEIAFKKQEWTTVINLLETKKEYLSELNLTRLNYARKKAQQHPTIGSRGPGSHVRRFE